MKVDKLSVSFDPDRLAEAAARLRAEALGDYLDGWEAEHGELTPEELARVSDDLGLRAVSKGEQAL